MQENHQDVKVLWLAESAYHADASLKEHAHPDYYQVHYILEGHGIFLIGGEQVDFEPGLFFFAAPGVTHGIRSIQEESNQTARLLEVKFSVFDAGLTTELAKQPAIGRGTEHLQRLLYETFLESVKPDLYAEKLVSHLFAAWLYQVMREHRNACQDAGRKPDIPRPVSYLKQYLDEHFAEDVSLHTLAEVTGYSKNYLCRMFHEGTGMTINAYLNAARINRAAELLTNTDLDVADIGRRCGYNSVHYFIKAFKKMIGVPPGSYRRSELTGVGLVTGEVESVSSAVSAFNLLLTHTDGSRKDTETT